MISESTRAVSIAVGIDTHADVNVAAVIDQVGRELGHASFDTSPAGHRRLGAWARSHGEIEIAFIAAHQFIPRQEEALNREEAETEEMLMHGGRAVGVERRR